MLLKSWFRSHAFARCAAVAFVRSAFESASRASAVTTGLTEPEPQEPSRFWFASSHAMACLRVTLGAAVCAALLIAKADANINANNEVVSLSAESIRR